MAGLPPLTLRFSSSVVLSCILLAQHVLVVFSLACFPFTPAVHFCLASCVLLCGLRILQSNRAAGGRWAMGLQLVGTELFVVGTEHRIRVRLVTATVWHCLVVLRLRGCENGRKLALVVLPDSCSRQHWRQLQVLLRHGLEREDA